MSLFPVEAVNASLIAVFGDSATLTKDGEAAPVRVDYSESYIALDENGQKVSIDARSAWVKANDLTARPAQGDVLEILEGDGVGVYEIADVRTDGSGGLRLILCEVPA